MKSFVLRFIQISSIALIVSSCAPQEDHVELYQVESDFEPYVQNFQVAGADEGKTLEISDLIVKFGDTPSMNETGVCEMTEGETPIITVNERIWNTLTPMDRQEVIFHELGHCVIRRNHISGLMVGASGYSIPDSIMYPYRIPGSIYAPNQVAYHEELFSKENEF